MVWSAWSASYGQKQRITWDQECEFMAAISDHGFYLPITLCNTISDTIHTLNFSRLQSASNTLIRSYFIYAHNIYIHFSVLQNYRPKRN